MTIPGEPLISCPKCHEPMRQLKAGTVVVDRCEKCYGIWLDKGERLKLMQDKSLVAGLDIGSEELGKVHNETTEIDCPRCDVRMQHLTDRAQRHVTFEHCNECDGSFFDAGELEDLSELTLSERLRSLFGH